MINFSLLYSVQNPFSLIAGRHRRFVTQIFTISMANKVRITTRNGGVQVGQKIVIFIVGYVAIRNMVREGVPEVFGMKQ
jgi:hypothetical protein